MPYGAFPANGLDGIPSLPRFANCVTHRFEAAARKKLERRDAEARNKAATEAFIRGLSRCNGGSKALVIPPWAITLGVSYRTPGEEGENGSLDSRRKRREARRPASAACLPRGMEEKMHACGPVSRERVPILAGGLHDTRRILRSRARPASAMDRSVQLYHAKCTGVKATAKEAACVGQKQAWWPSECILDALRQRSRSSRLTSDKYIPGGNESRTQRRHEFSRLGCRGPRRDVLTPEVLAKELEFLVRLESRLHNAGDSSSS